MNNYIVEKLQIINYVKDIVNNKSNIYRFKHSLHISINQLLSGVSFLYPLRTSKNLLFFYIFRRYKMGTQGSNGLNYNKPLHQPMIVVITIAVKIESKNRLNFCLVINPFHVTSLFLNLLER